MIFMHRGVISSAFPFLEISFPLAGETTMKESTRKGVSARIIRRRSERKGITRFTIKSYFCSRQPKMTGLFI